MSSNGTEQVVGSVEHIEPVGQKVVELKSTFRRSEEIGKLITALTKAQLSFGAVKKDAENPAYSRGTKRSMYATMDSVIDATRKPLAENGLAILAIPQEMVDDKRLRITSVLAHTSDQFIESTMTMTAVDRVTPQELGKLITYARRYQWSSLAGVAPEDDEDANNSSGVGSKEAAQGVAQRKIAEHDASKPVSAKSNGASSQPIENLSIIPIDGGDSRLEGKGLPRLLAALDVQDPHFKKTYMRFDAAEGFWFVHSGKAFILVDICTSVGINAVLSDGDKAEMSVNDSDLPAAMFPNIESCISRTSKAGNGKPASQWLEVWWGGVKHVCFKKPLWDALSAGQNHPADLITESGTPSPSITGIRRIGNREYDEFSVPVRNSNDQGAMSFT